MITLNSIRYAVFSYMLLYVYLLHSNALTISIYPALSQLVNRLNDGNIIVQTTSIFRQPYSLLASTATVIDQIDNVEETIEDAEDFVESDNNNDIDALTQDKESTITTMQFGFPGFGNFGGFPGFGGGFPGFGNPFGNNNNNNNDNNPFNPFDPFSRNRNRNRNNNDRDRDRDRDRNNNNNNNRINPPDNGNVNSVHDIPIDMNGAETRIGEAPATNFGFNDISNLNSGLPNSGRSRRF